MPSPLGPQFNKLTLAAASSNIGDGVFAAAFPLLVASLTREPLLVAGASLAGRLPWLLFALISGALVDRMDRKRVMIATNALRATGVGLLAWGVASGEVGLLAVYAVAFGLGVAETFFDTSAEAMVPALVEISHLPAANGRLQAVEWVGNAFAGPPLGALLFATAAFAPFALDAAGFASAAIVLTLIPGPFRFERAEETTLRSDISSGLRFLLSQPILRSLAVMAGITNMGAFGIIAIFVLFAQDILGVGESGYGILLSALGVGGLAGALIGPRMVARFGPGNVLRATLVTQAATVVFFGGLSSPWIGGALMVLYGGQVTAWNVVSVSLRQRLTPDQLRGRVAGASRLVAWGTQPIGALMGRGTPPNPQS